LVKYLPFAQHTSKKYLEDTKIIYYNKCSVVVEMGDRLATINMGRKLGKAVPLLGGAEVTQCGLGRGYTFVPSGILMHPAVWPQQTWAENWEAVPLWGREARSPSNAMWPGARPICMPSFILIHPTVWPQYTIVTDMTDRQDSQQFDSIGRTVLQTVAQRDIIRYQVRYYLLVS